MKRCSDCKWCWVREKPSGANEFDYRCAHPDVSLNVLVSEQLEPSMLCCTERRDCALLYFGPKCGRQGRLWERKQQ